MYDKNKQMDLDYIKDLEEQVAELTRALKWCVQEMKYSAEVGQPISLNRVEFEMAAKALRNAQ